MPQSECTASPAPYHLHLRVANCPNYCETLTFDTLEELEEVIAYAHEIRERGRERRKRAGEYPLTAADCYGPQGREFISGIVKSCLIAMMPTSYVQIERCDIQHTLKNT